MRNLIYIVILSIFYVGQLYSQTGCTDILANNYDPLAVQNDGSCTYDPVNIDVSNTYLLDPVIEETSGLIYWDDKLWTHNDNADTNLYALDPEDGSIVGNISLFPQTNTDWEEISQDADYVYVGDFGNNTQGNRRDLKIIRILKSSILNREPEMDLINFEYENQDDFSPHGPNNTDFDCEALIVTDNDIYLFTKEWISHKTRLYKLPKVPGTYSAQLLDSYQINGLVTGAVYNEEKDLVVLSGYSTLLQPFVELLYDYPEADFLKGNKRKIAVNLPFHQVEGIGSEDGLNYFLTNEKFASSGTVQQLHTLDLSAYLGGNLEILPIEDSSRFVIFPNPTDALLEIKDIHKIFPVKYKILDSSSRIVSEGILTSKENSIDFTQFPNGIYILKLGEKTKDIYKVIKK